MPGCGNCEITVSGDDNDTVDVLLKRRDPVGHKGRLAARWYSTRVTKVLRIFELASLKRSITSVVVDAKLSSEMSFRYTLK